MVGANHCAISIPEAPFGGYKEKLLKLWTHHYMFKSWSFYKQYSFKDELTGK